MPLIPEEKLKSHEPVRLPRRLDQWKYQITAASLVYGICPLTIAAIMDRESLGGDALTPRGAAGRGDKGYGHGLMQVDSRWHPQFTASGLWSDPAFNVMYGVRLLATLRLSFKGDWVAAIAGYNAGAGVVREVLRAAPGAEGSDKIKLLDSVTTGDDYVSDVLRRREGFIAAKGGTTP